MFSWVDGCGLTEVCFGVGAGGEGEGEISFSKTFFGFPMLMPGGFCAPEVLSVIEVIFAIQTTPFVSGTIKRSSSASGSPSLSCAMIRFTAMLMGKAVWYPSEAVNWIEPASGGEIFACVRR